MAISSRSVKEENEEAERRRSAVPTITIVVPTCSAPSAPLVTHACLPKVVIYPFHFTVKRVGGAVAKVQG